MAKQHTRSELRTLKTVAKAQLTVATDICKTIAMLRDRENRQTTEYKCYHRAWEVAEERRKQAEATYNAYLAQSREAGNYGKKKNQAPQDEGVEGAVASQG